MDYVSKRINVVFSSKDTEKLPNVYIRSRKCFLFLEQQSLDLVFSGVCVTQSLLYPRSPKGEGGILFYLYPSIQDIFRRIFLCNCWYLATSVI
jgi:hypothetical protein